MTAPRAVHPGRVHFVTRSTLQHQFLLRTSPEARRIFEYCFGEAVERYGLTCLALVVMSTHYHAVLFDPRGNLPLFFAHFHKMLAQLMNEHLVRSGQFWEAEQTSSVELVDVESILEAVVYTLANPVQDDLVDRAEDWPGLTSLRDMGRQSRTIARPDEYFGARSVMPLSVPLEFVSPQGFKGTAEEWFALVRRRVDARARAARIERQAKGRRCAGVDAVLRASTSDTPATTLPHGALKPVVKAASPGRRSMALAARQLFQRLYGKALAAFRGGARDTVFPAGTFAMRVRYNVAVAPS